jgi:hypothetical protein
LKVGDFLLDSEDTFCEIISINKVLKKGIYAPLTKNGTLIVNGFKVSCYASTQFQSLGTIMLRPLIWKQMILPRKDLD